MMLAKPARVALFLVVGMAPPAMAADWDDDTTRRLSSPSYLPYAGELNAMFTYTHVDNTYESGNTSPFSFPSSYSRHENAFLPNLTYGITDDIAVFADLEWGNSRTGEDYTYERFIFGPPFRRVPTGGHASFRSLGADDPSFGGTWRAIDQRRAPVNVDLTASYQPNIFRDRTSGSLQAGAFADGGQSGSLQAAISRDMTGLTLRAYGTFSYEGRRHDNADYGTEILRSAAHASYAAGLQGEVRLLPRLALNLGVQAEQAVQFDQFTISAQNVSPVTIRPGGTVSPFAGLVLTLVPHRLVTELLYQHDFTGEQTDVYAAGDSQRLYRQHGNEYAVHVLFSFGGPSRSAPPAPPLTDEAPPIPAPAVDRSYLVFFDWDRADLSNRARQIVAAAAQGISHAPTTRIEVNGYTDLSGTRAYNQLLSLRRAHAVESELVRDGVSPGEIGIHGYGEQNPLVPTAPGVREAQNRRVEILWR